VSDPALEPAASRLMQPTASAGSASEQVKKRGRRGGQRTRGGHGNWHSVAAAQQRRAAARAALEKDIDDIMSVFHDAGGSCEDPLDDAMVDVDDDDVAHIPTTTTTAAVTTASISIASSVSPAVAERERQAASSVFSACSTSGLLDDAMVDDAHDDAAHTPTTTTTAAATSATIAPASSNTHRRRRVGSTGQMERQMERLRVIQERETAGLLRMSHGLLIAAASTFHTQSYEESELPCIALNVGASPEPRAAIQALAHFGCTMVMGRQPTTRALATLAQPDTCQSTSRAGQPTDLPFDVICLLVDKLELLADVAKVACLNHWFYEAAQTLAQARRQERLKDVACRPENTEAYFHSICGRRVVVATFWNRHRRWLPFSGILEYDVSWFPPRHSLSSQCFCSLRTHRLRCPLPCRLNVNALMWRSTQSQVRSASTSCGTSQSDAKCKMA
jgi:hypothetical protein